MVTLVAQVAVDTSDPYGLALFSDLGKPGVTFQLTTTSGLFHEANVGMVFTGDFIPSDDVGTIHNLALKVDGMPWWELSGLSLSLSELIMAGSSSHFPLLAANIFSGNDHITGAADAYSDFLYGFAGNDVINGRAGHDFLYGGPGNDILNGGPGVDVLTGGPGHDKFVFSNSISVDDDVIWDFTHGIDKIELAHAIFGKLPKGALAPGNFHIGPAAHDANDFLVYDGKGDLYYDPDGNGPKHQIFFAQVEADALHHATLSASDFIVI